MRTVFGKVHSMPSVFGKIQRMIKSFRHPIESVILACIIIYIYIYIMDDQELLKTLGPHDSDLPD